MVLCVPYVNTFPVYLQIRSRIRHILRLKLNTKTIDPYRQGSVLKLVFYAKSSLPGSDFEINALVRGSSVVLQKSLKEGFGLTVSEALWKERPVIAGAVGGIQFF